MMLSGHTAYINAAIMIPTRLIATPDYGIWPDTEVSTVLRDNIYRLSNQPEMARPGKGRTI